MFQPLVIFIFTLTGGVIPLLFKNHNSNFFKLTLIFSGSYLLSINVLHILPELYSKYSPILGIFVLIGFIFQTLIEGFSGGLEHGHAHINFNNSKNKNEKFFILLSSIAPIFVLCLHSFMDSMILLKPELNHHHHYHHHGPLLMGMILHKAPVAFALMTLFKKNKIKLKYCLLTLVVFSSCTPLGLFLFKFFDIIQNSKIINLLWAIGVGSFLHISSTIFFENHNNHSFNIKQSLVLILGALVGVILEFLH